jgi:hypothetical protein
MSVKIQGATGTIAEVEPATQAQVTNLLLTASLAGFAVGAAESDPGTIVARTVRGMEITDDHRLRTGVDSLMFQDAFTGAAINTALWLQATTTMTIAVASGYVTLNSGAIVTAATAARVQSYRTFPIYGTFPTYFDCIAVYQTANPVPPANSVTELGVGFATGVAAPTDGAFFRWNALGEFRCIVVFNGVEYTSAALTFPSIGVRHAFSISTHRDNVEFWIDGVLQARVGIDAAAPLPTSAVNQPILMRTYTSAIAPVAAVQLRVAEATVTLGDMGPIRAWPIVMAGTGQSAVQGQTGGTMGSTANYANSAAPASAALSNTAAGYTTFGGQWQFVAVAGAETDYALFGFQVPAGSATVAGKNLYITGVRISSFNTVVAVAGTATVLQWSLGLGSTAVSLATAEGAGTRARRVFPIGVQSFPVAAAVGANVPDIVQTFQTPQMVDAGTFVHVILKMPIATATATEIFRGTVTIEGFFE